MAAALALPMPFNLEDNSSKLAVLILIEVVDAVVCVGATGLLMQIGKSLAKDADEKLEKEPLNKGTDANKTWHIPCSHTMIYFNRLLLVQAIIF